MNMPEDSLPLAHTDRHFAHRLYEGDREGGLEPVNNNLIGATGRRAPLSSLTALSADTVELHAVPIHDESQGPRD